MRLHTPAQLEAFTGLSTVSQRAWRASGLLTQGSSTSGGHWRFSDDDVLWVAAVRAVAGMGFELAVAAMLVETFSLEIKGGVTGRPIVHPGARFAFVWKREDATEEGERAAKEMLFTWERWLHGEWRTEALTVFSQGDYCAVGPDHLDVVPLLSRAGGSVVILNDIPRRLPAAVIDLFTEPQAED